MGFLRRLFGGSQSTAIQVQVSLLTPDRDDAVVDIVGEGSYQESINRVAGGKTEDGPARPDHVAILWPESNNKYDRNAIAIKIDGMTMGYLAREVAVRYGPVTRWADSHGRKIACNAKITGGWYRGRGDSGSYGVQLLLGSPGECILDMLGEEVAVRTDHPWSGHLIAFTGESTCTIHGVTLDRESSELLAKRAGIEVHPRVTKKVTLLVDCDPASISDNERKANEYGVPVVSEVDFWAALGVPVTAS